MQQIKTLSTLVLLVFFAQLTWAQTCPSEVLHLKSQADIDNFSTVYPNCTALPNGLVIGTQDYEPPSDITNLNGLSQLTEVGSYFIINRTQLTNLVGLSNLTNVILLDISHNSQLTSFTGLSSLHTIAHNFNIYRNDKLTNFAGLEALQTIQGSLVIGLTNGGNATLQNLEGLSSLTNINGFISILHNPELTNLSGISSLTSVQGIKIWGNDKLSDISGLQNIDYQNLVELSIITNPILATCNIAPFCSYLENTGASVSISSNMEGCNSVGEVTLACNPALNLVLTCPDPINIAVPTGATEVTVNWDEPAATSNCASGTITLSSNIASGTSLGIGQYTVTYQAVDNCSNTESCSFLVTVGATPADYEINITNCPTAFPNSGVDYIVDFTFTNTGGTPTDPMSLLLGQPYTQFGSQEFTVKGGVAIPSVAPGETYSASHNFGPANAIPADFELATWSTLYSPFFALKTNFPPYENNAQGTVGIYCKKFNSELKVEVLADSYLIDADGNLEYDIKVSNIGTEMAANIMTHVAPTLWNKNVVSVSNTPPGSKVWYSKGNKEDMFLNIPVLAAGSSETFHVSIHIQGEIDPVFEPNVYIYSNHQLNQQTYYDVNNAAFSQDSGGGTCSAIAGFTKLGDYNGHGYYMSDANKPWAQAKTLAENAGGYLVSINTQAENDFVKSKIGNKLVYIGFNDVASEGSGQWANGEPVSLDLSYNNTSANDFAVMNFWAGTWQMEQAGPWRKYIMEMSCGSSTSDIDLTVNNITNLPASGTPGSVVNFNFNLNNLGTSTVSDSYIIGMYLSTDATYSSDDSFVGQIPTGGTPPGTIANIPAAISLTGISDGSYYLIVVADKDNNVAESNENNNTISAPFNVSAGNGGGGSCADIAGYTKLGTHNGHTYYMSDGKNNWVGSKGAAEAAGGYLATINDQSENDFIQNLLNKEMVFIGYNDAQTEGSGQWTNNEPVTLDLSYANSGSNDYAVMNFWAGTWQLTSGQGYRKHILEMDCGTTTTPTSCGTIAGFTSLGEQNGHGYYMSDDPTTWLQAKTLAENAGGYLATMNDQAENDFLKSKLDNNMVFIGYNDGTTEGTGQWATNEAVTLDLSYSNTPENDYAIMNFWAGTWQLVNQYVAKKYVMELNCNAAQPAPIFIPEANMQQVNLLSVFPNPATDIVMTRIQVQEDSELSIGILDARGQLLLSEKRTFAQGVSEYSFDISHLPSGIYFVKLSNGAYKRFVKMN